MVDDPCDPLYVVGMGGRRKPQIVNQVCVDYSPCWSENNRVLASMMGYHTEEEAMQSAIEQTDEMRKRGADSAVRLIRVLLWGGDAKLKDAPVLYQASYYDPEQKLTDTEVYAARVHHWHVVVDRCNPRLIARNSKWLMGYSDWDDEWGLRPTVCPACGAIVSPQPTYG